MIKIMSFIKLNIITICLIFPYLLLSTDLTGTVTDNISGLPLYGASIRIENTDFGSFTKKDGSFTFKNLKPGKYTIIATYIGYHLTTSKINIQSDNLNLKIELTESQLKTSEIVVSANKKLQAVQDVPISMAIIESSKIIEKGATQFDEVLRYVSGIQMNQDNISIRGSSGFSFGLGSRVSLLIDGNSMMSGDNGDIKFDILPSFDIERIEIIKGSGSALYGTGAMGGVVNIITIEPTEDAKIKYRTYAGLYTKPTYQQWVYRNSLASKAGTDLTYSQKIGNLGIMLSGGLQKDDSYHAYYNSDKWNLFSKLKYDFSDLTKVSVLANYATDNTTDWAYWNSLDSATLPPSNTNYDIRFKSNKLILNSEIKHIFSSSFFGSAKISLFRTDFQNSFPTSSTFFRSSKANSYTSEIQLNNKIDDNTQLTYGVSYYFNQVSSSTFGEHDQNNIAGYAQIELTQITNLIATAGIRLDKENITGSKSNMEFSPKLGFNYKVQEDFNLRASIGHGYRAPTIAEKYASLNYQGLKVVPNPDLLPEKSWSAEVGIHYEIPVLSKPILLDASVFTNWMDNLIEPQFDLSVPNEAPIKFLNITSARIVGFEIEAKTLLFNFLGVQSSLTLMDPKDLSLNQTLKYRSKILWYNGIIIPLPYAELQADYRYLSKVENVDPSLGLQIKDYDARVPVHVLDIRLSIKFQDLVGVPLNLRINCNNILNYYYTEVPGNLAKTRFIGLQLDGSL
jgi:outer membrane receptor for ferrienterochelin and colicins